MKRQEKADSKDKKSEYMNQKDMKELNEKELDKVSGGREENISRDPWDDWHH